MNTERSCQPGGGASHNFLAMLGKWACGHAWLPHPGTASVALVTAGCPACKGLGNQLGGRAIRPPTAQPDCMSWAQHGALRRPLSALAPGCVRSRLPRRGAAPGPAPQRPVAPPESPLARQRGPRRPSRWGPLRCRPSTPRPPLRSTGRRRLRTHVAAAVGRFWHALAQPVATCHYKLCLPGQKPPVCCRCSARQSSLSRLQPPA